MLDTLPHRERLNSICFCHTPSRFQSTLFAVSWLRSVPSWQVGPVAGALSEPTAALDHPVGDRWDVARGLRHLNVALPVIAQNPVDLGLVPGSDGHAPASRLGVPIASVNGDLEAAALSSISPVLNSARLLRFSALWCSLLTQVLIDRSRPIVEETIAPPTAGSRNPTTDPDLLQVPCIAHRHRSEAWRRGCTLRERPVCTGLPAGISVE